MSSLCTGSANLFLGSADGHVHIVSSGFKVVRSFKASDAGSITHIKQIEGSSLLVTIAEDLLNEPVLKVWALDKSEKKTGSPRCLSTTSIQNARRLFPVCVVVRDNIGIFSKIYMGRYRHSRLLAIFHRLLSDSPTVPSPSFVAT